MSKIDNTSSLDVDVCEESVTISSNTVDVEIVDLEIVKTVNCPWTVTGGTLRFCTAITNPSEDIDIEDALFHDTLNGRLTYVTGSFTVDGHPATPTVSGQSIEYVIPEIPAGETVTICFDVTVGPETA